MAFNIFGKIGETFLGKNNGRLDNEFRDVDPNGRVRAQADQANAAAYDAQNGFFGEQGVGVGLSKLNDAGNYYQRVMRGQDSLSAEQLRQGLQQNRNAQMSAAASARPQSAAMAHRNAAIQMGRLGAGLAGQQSLAGIAERQGAAQGLAGVGNAYSNISLQNRGQNLEAMNAQRGLATQAEMGTEAQRGQRFAASAGVPTSGEQILGLGSNALAAYAAKSDERDKESVSSGKAAAKGLLEGLRPQEYSYKPAAQSEEDERQDRLARRDALLEARRLERYRNIRDQKMYARAEERRNTVNMPPDDVRFEKPGGQYLRMPGDNLRKGEAGRPRYVGVMAQDLEKTPLGNQAVLNTPTGKKVDPGQLSLGLAAGLGYLYDEVKRLKGEKK